jgi:diketogulonate reductase-like aldo/keto reductase
LSRGEHVAPIPCSKQRRRLEEDFGALQIVLDPAELARIDAVLPPDAVSGACYRDSMLALSAP